MKLPVHESSYGRTYLGWCGALLADDVECSRPDGHLGGDLPHRAHSPMGTSWIEYDDDGNVLARGGLR